MAIVRRVFSEVIIFWELPSIPKTSEPFEKLLELLSFVIFDAEPKPDISDKLVSFDDVIILELWCMVDSMAADELFCKFEIDASYFMNNQEEHPSEPVWNAEALDILLYDLCP